MLCKELVENAKLHGKSFAFTTIQYNYKHERVYVSIADCGKGFITSMNSQLTSAEPNEENHKVFNDEFDAIVHGIYKRNNKPYGIYKVIKDTLLNGGTVRIHSMNTQIILTEKLLDTILSGDAEKPYY